MLDKETLFELKLKMPRNFARKVSDEHKKLAGKPVSRWTVDKFFKAKSYSEDLHSAVLSVASNQHLLMEKQRR